MRQEVVKHLATVREEELHRDAGLAYLKGMLGQGEDALLWLSRAHAIAGIDPALSARITFELGFAYLRRSRIDTAQAVLACGEAKVASSAQEPADLFHLRALIADRHGDYVRAADGYRETIRRSATALTPMTEVLAMKNLAVALHHRHPDEAVSLCTLALATVEAAELHQGIVPVIQNAMGYGLICCGELGRARETLADAAVGAREFGAVLTALFAEFNRSIVTELEGDPAHADQDLQGIETAAATLAGREFLGWIRVRRAWLALRQGRPSDAIGLLRSEFGQQLRMPYRDSVETVEALVAVATGDLQKARRGLTTLFGRCVTKGDDLTAMTLLLWLALVEHRAGRRVAATRAVRQAHDLGRVGGFRVSPNWWMSPPVATARALGGEAMAPFFDRLLDSGDGLDGSPPARVKVHSDGTLSIGGRAVPLTIWREGRSGSGVLARLFRTLATNPSGVHRDRLCDTLWPESDGDRARRNLYAATDDLRRVLSSIAGLRLETDGAMLKLVGDANVDFERQPARNSRRS